MCVLYYGPLVIFGGCCGFITDSYNRGTSPSIEGDHTGVRKINYQEKLNILFYIPLFFNFGVILPRRKTTS